MPPPYLFLSVAAFFYLSIDVYILVKSFRAPFATLSFWVLWFLYTFLSTIAYGFLTIASGEKIASFVGDRLTEPTLVLLAILGTIGIIQNLTLKIGDIKFFDLGGLLDAFRGRVLEDIARKSAAMERLRAMKVADKLARKYQDNAAGLRDQYAAVMSFGGRTIGEIKQELQQLEQEASHANLSFVAALARRIAQADPDRADQLVSPIQEL